MAEINQGPKGTQTLFPEVYGKWRYATDTLIEIAELYGYDELEVPIFEHTEVFVQSVGESSDVVQKEMYTFKDKGDRSLTLRPEMTAGVVRSLIEQGKLSDPMPLKYCYLGPCFRYEKPQAGRFREFHQFGIEAFGSQDPAVDAECIKHGQECLQTLGITDIVLKLNSIGCPNCRPAYHDKLVEYFKAHEADLDEDSIRRLSTNPLRILDSKVEKTKKIVAGAPKMDEMLCDECRDHFAEVKRYLGILGIDYELDSSLVRGLDYYTKTVFEFVTNTIGAQGTVLGGGRYDGLVGARGGVPTPAVGYAMGIERLILVMEAANAPFPEPMQTLIYFASTGQAAKDKAFELTHMLRAEGFRVAFDQMDRSVKAQMKYANKLGAKYTLVIGDDEIKSGVGKLHNMENGEDVEVALDETLVDYIYNTQISEAMIGIEKTDILWENPELSE